jgi:hypothetical protein
MSDTNTPIKMDTNGAPQSAPTMELGRSSKPIIKMDGTGGIDFELFAQASGVSLTGEPKDEPEEEIGEETRKEVDTTQPGQKEAKEAKKKEETEEEESDDSEEEEEEESDEQEEQTQKAKAKGKKYVAKGPDGEEVQLSGDHVFTKMVDGELQEVKLEEALSIVAGERTVQARLGEIGQFYGELKKERESVKAKEEQIVSTYAMLQDLAQLADKGKPEQVLAKLAEMRGESPAKFFKNFAKQVQHWAKALHGKSPEQLEAYFNKVDADFHAKRAKQIEDSAKEKESEQHFLRFANQKVVDNGLSKKEFLQAKDVLKEAGELNELSREEAVERVVTYAVTVRHGQNILAAVEMIDPTLAKNEELLLLTFEHTKPNHTVEQIAEILSEVVGKKRKQISETLSRKALKDKDPKAVAKAGKSAGDGIVFKSANEIVRSMFEK